MITKSDVYKSLIDIQKQSGQGLSGIVKVKSQEYSQYLDELIQEGLVKANHTGGSIGHPESNVFYMPTKGYNVWEDEGTDGNYSRNKGRYLHFVRLYLGLVTLENKGPLEPGLLTYLQDPDTMKGYTEWLTRNDKALKEMLSLSDYYKDDAVVDITLSPDEINWVKSRNWYEQNMTIAKCLKQSIEGQSKDDELISLNKQLIKLYKTNLSKYGDQLKESEIENDNIKKWRRNVNRWLQNQDSDKKIQSIL
jgi:hypothetical protein